MNWRANSPATRGASHNTALINQDEHVRWLTNTLKNPNRKLFVAEIDGVPVGTVRMDSETLGYELSWTVSPMMRGSGIGKVMVPLLADDINEPIRAEIKAGNIASIRIAEEAGMVFEREDNGVLHYRRDALQSGSTRTEAAD